MKDLNPIRVVIDNYQSISHLDFEVKGFTCIVGVSNVGKSAILRAISGAILNDPVINKVKKGQKVCSVQLLSKDWSLKWEKGSGVSRYWIPADADKALDKVGAGQIEPVSELGFKSIKIGGEWKEPWYADQWQPLFLLQETGSTVSEFISDVSNLQTLQDSITIANKGKRSTQDEVKAKQTETVSLKEKLQKLSTLDSLLQIEKDIQAQVSSIDEYEKKTVHGEKLLKKLDSSKKQIQSLAKTDSIKHPKKVDISADVQKMTATELWWLKLEAHVKRLVKLKPLSSVKVPLIPHDEIKKYLQVGKFANLPKRIENLKKFDALDSIKSPSSVNLNKDFDNIKLMAKHATIAAKTDKLRDVIKQDEKLLAHVQEQILNVKDQIRKFPKCPTCERVMKPMSEGHVHATS